MEAKKRKAEDAIESAPDDDVVSEEDIAELAEILSKEELVSIVKQAALSNADILSKLKELADQDPAACKIFVGGLNKSTDRDTLKDVFKEYGPVKEAIVVKEKTRGKSRRFGFVIFKHRDSAIRAVKQRSRIIEGSKTFCHLSVAREARAASVKAASGKAASVKAASVPPLLQVSSETAAASAKAASVPPLLQVSSETDAASRKIYVGHFPKNMQKNTLLDFFSQYGEIEEGPLGFDNKSGKCKGFTLIKYKTQESVRECLKEPYKEIDGHKVQCKLADPPKSKDEGVKLGSSSVGYDLTDPALIASHNPSFLQSSSHSFGQWLNLAAGMASLHGIDPLLPRSLPPDSAHASSSLASMYGLSNSDHGTLSSSYPSFTMMHNRQASGYSSLPRSSFY